MMSRDAYKRSLAFFLFFATAAIGSPAQITFNTLVNFYRPTTGAYPLGSLVQGPDGNLYGTTSQGGTYDFGTVFRITPSGRLTTLYNFCSQSGCPDGNGPGAGLVQATDGNLYGTTTFGGAHDAGTVFKISLSGALTTLYNFCAQPGCADGEFPLAGVIQASDGNFYGTTEEGGASSFYGTVFKITPSGSLTTLYSFCAQPNCADGGIPFAGVIQATDGNLYGTTESGGDFSEGTVFKITPTGTLSVLYSFCAQPKCTDGARPYVGVTQGSDGNLYGTTYSGGASDLGTVFKISPGPELSVLHSFCTTDCDDGQSPDASLIQGIDGNFYGSTASGGIHSRGTLFEITPSGALTTLHSFDYTHGSSPEAALVEATDGTFYGTAQNGGAHFFGTVFSLSVGLGPFVGFVNDTGRIGSPVGILGQGFIGTTSVSFNGTAASFTVTHDTFLTAVVPPGATTGFVTVATPSGSLSSNVPFRVRF